MVKEEKIYVYEYGWLIVGKTYNDEVVFDELHLRLMARYLTENSNCPFYTLYYDRVKFSNYVGVIKVGHLTIEVLPKTDRHDVGAAVWHKVLIEMLTISLQVEAKTTTPAAIHIKKHSVLETYIQIFLDEVERILREGLVKKYRKETSNQTALKGKFLIHQQITKNLVHAERFYVSHQVYDRNNLFNSIIGETLVCLLSLNVSDSLSRRTKAILLNFPECDSLSVSEKLFQRLRYDRKTERYKKAIELARIILLNYHPDIKGGKNHILAIMFDMNRLWESYIFWALRKAVNSGASLEYEVKPQQKKLFWQQDHSRTLRLKPDIVLTKVGDDGKQTRLVIDTKWKYQSGVSIQDVRQMFAYGNYFQTSASYLLYPERLVEQEKVKISKGNFYEPTTSQLSENNACGLMFVDLLQENKLNTNIGKEILSACFENI